MAFSLTDAIKRSKHYNDPEIKKFTSIISDAYQDYFTTDMPKEKLSSWENYYYLGDPIIPDFRVAGGDWDSSDGIPKLNFNAINANTHNATIALGNQKMVGGTSEGFIPNSNLTATYQMSTGLSSWCTIGFSKNNEYYNITVNASDNEGGNARSGTVTIMCADASQTFKVYQYADLATSVPLYIRFRWSKNSSDSYTSGTTYGVACNITGEGDQIRNNECDYKILNDTEAIFTVNLENNGPESSSNFTTIMLNDPVFYESSTNLSVTSMNAFIGVLKAPNMGSFNSFKATLMYTNKNTDLPATIYKNNEPDDLVLSGFTRIGSTADGTVENVNNIALDACVNPTTYGKFIEHWRKYGNRNGVTYNASIGSSVQANIGILFLDIYLHE